MSAVLVDSDVLIDVLRYRKSALVQQWRDLASSGAVVCYSPISLVEIRLQMPGPDSDAVGRLFSALLCASIGDDVGEQAGEYLRTFHKTHGFTSANALIAATASVYGLALSTQNRKHFPMKGIRFFGEHRGDNKNRPV